MIGKTLIIIHNLYQDDVHFPLGPAYLASVLEQAGAEVQIYDQAVSHQTNEELAQFLDESEWDLIGVSFLAARYKETVEPLLEVISKHKKDAWLVVGGHGPAPIPDFILRTTPTDIVALGEAEESIVELLDAKINNTDLSKIKGIAYKEGNATIINERRQPPNVDNLPLPAWHLFDMEYYSTCLKLYNQEPNDRVLTILTSRGCKYHCSFCYRLEKGIRLRSIDNIMDEMKLLKERYGINYYLIADELFIITKKRLFEFRDALSKNGLKIKFTCDACADIDEETAWCLKECGCQFVNIGFESMDNTVLKLMNKRFTAEDNERVAEVCKKMGLLLGLNILWGNPGDTVESLQKGVEFIKKYNSYSQIRTIKFCTPYPGSPLYYRAIDEGKLNGPADFFEKFRNLDRITVNFMMNISDEEAYKYLYQKNCELIWDHKIHTDMTSEEAHNICKDYFRLFFVDRDYKYRGSRHYSKDNESR